MGVYFNQAHRDEEATMNKWMPLLRCWRTMPQELLSKGRAVRALVRDVDKAKQLLVRTCNGDVCGAALSDSLATSVL